MNPDSLVLTNEMITVFGVIGVLVTLFVTEWVRVDVVAILAMVALPMLGLVDGQEAFSGFGSSAVISIIAVIILGRGLDHTGVIGRVVRPVVKLAGNSHPRIVTLISVVIAFISSVMQNIGAAALFLPALRRICRDTKLSLSRLLIPVGSAAILGGTITLVGSSPLIILNDLMAPYGLEPFGLFSVTPAGLALVAAGIVYYLLLGKYVLPTTQVCELQNDYNAQEEEYYSELGMLYEITLRDDAPIQPTLLELGDALSVHVVALHSKASGATLIPPALHTKVERGSTLAVFGSKEQVEEAAETYGFELRGYLEVFAESLSSEYAGVVEAVVSPHSRFIGKSIMDISFRQNHLVTPLAIFREQRTYYSYAPDLKLQSGDAILMHGAWERFQAFRQGRDLIFSHSLDHEIMHPNKARCAIACFGLATLLVLFSGLSLPVCLMAGAIGMVLTRVITIDEAYRGVDWRTIFLLAGLIPLGLAAQKTGAAAWLAHQLVQMLDQPSELTMLLLVGALSTVFTLVVSNVGATVLLVPLVVELARAIGADPRLAALVVGLAASNSFMLPTHQVNALYMGPGSYTSMDFLKAGTPLSVLFLLVLTAVIYLFY
jgi:di/tricarboxylate transporter